jgi:hypothetical protein
LSLLVALGPSPLPVLVAVGYFSAGPSYSESGDEP